jgi:hypothetical protein
VLHPSRPERPAVGTISIGTGRPDAWRWVAGKACGKGQVCTDRTKRAHDRPAPAAIRLDGYRLRRRRSRRTIGHQVLVHGRCAPAGARPGEESSCLRPKRTALAFPMSRTTWFDLAWVCHGRTGGRGDADPPPSGCIAVAANNPRDHASTGSGHGAPATGTPVRINGAQAGWSKLTRPAIVSVASRR